MREEEAVVAVIGMLSLLAFSCVTIRHIHLTIKAWFDAAVKRDMVARGYTAQEIIAVVDANERCLKKLMYDVPPAKPIRQPAYSS
jgi:hypothetical protein